MQRVAFDELRVDGRGERGTDRRLAAPRYAHDEDVAAGSAHAGGGTSVGSGSPRTPATRFAAAIAAILPRVARDADAMCGTIRQLSRPTSGSSIGIGSGSVTSSAAAQMTPSRSAVANARWSTTGPRDVFTSTAVDFIMASVSALIRCRVTSDRFTWSDTKSLRGSNRSSGR